MSGTSETCRPPISMGTSRSTCLPESGAGPSPSSSPAGPDLFGPPPAHAPSSPSRREASTTAQIAMRQTLYGYLTKLAGRLAECAGGSGKSINSISGPRFGGSSGSKDLQSYLESRLRNGGGHRGGRASNGQWRWLVTLSGVRYCLLPSSAPITGGTGGFTCAWTNPKAKPRWGESNNMLPPLRAIAAGESLSVAGKIMWSTPLHRDWQGNPGSKRAHSSLPRQAFQIGGISFSLSAKTAKMLDSDQSLRLNPSFTRWLMGYPRTWERECPHFRDWRIWQGLTDEALRVRGGTESAPSPDTATR